MAPERPVRWLDEAEMRAWEGFMRMHMQLEATLGRELQRDAALSSQDYAVLVCLSSRPDGRLRAFELGGELGWEKSRLSHHISRMARRELVERQQCPSDHRGSFVVLTGRGRAVIEAAAPAHVAAVRRYFVDLLDREQLEELAAIAARVLAALPSPSEVCSESSDCHDAGTR